MTPSKPMPPFFTSITAMKLKSLIQKNKLINFSNSYFTHHPLPNLKSNSRSNRSLTVIPSTKGK